MSSNGFLPTLLSTAVPPKLSGLSEEQEEQRKTKSTRDAVERHRTVEDFMDIRGGYYPGLAAMKEIISQPETSQGLEELRSQMEKDHRKNIQTLRDFQARDYLAEADARYLSKDDSLSMPPEIEEFYQRIKEPNAYPMDAMSEAYTAYRYAHLKEMTTLDSRRVKLAAEEERARRERDAHFPQNLEQYNEADRVIALRVARFLTADTMTKERMLSEYGWAWRQVRPLEQEFAKNEAFKMTIENRAEESDTPRNPRRRPSVNTSL